MAELKNDFTWSLSRDGCFRTCPRRYYYHYYASWGGWEATAPERARRLYVLKKLKTASMWVGERVHVCIQRTLENLRRGITVLSPGKIVEVTLAQMREDFRSSRAGTYWKRPKTCALFEHEYRIPVSDERWRGRAAAMETCLRNFYGSELFAMLRALPREAWLEVEKLDKFTLDGIKVWARLDCAFRDRGLLHIYDWKTGKSLAEENSIQLVCYSLYAQQKWGVGPEELRTSEYYLLVDRLQDYRVTPGDIEDAKAYIRGSVADMASLLVDAAGNVPMAEGAFAKTENLAACRRCDFVGECRQDVAAALAAGPQS